MPYSLHQAATATGLNKSTVLRAIKAGKIAASRKEHGEWQLEPAELHRVYPPVAERSEGTDAPHQYCKCPGACGNAPASRASRRALGRRAAPGAVIRH